MLKNLLLCGLVTFSLTTYASTAKSTELDVVLSARHENAKSTDPNKQSRDNQPFTIVEWIANRKAEARKLPVAERKQYVANASAKLIDTLFSGNVQIGVAIWADFSFSPRRRNISYR